CATNCLSAQPEYLPCNASNGFDLLKASMALPLIYGPVVPIDGVPYIDGGLTDSIPLQKALEHDAARVIAVLTQPKGYRKRPALKTASLLALYYRKYPALAPAFAQRAARYNACLDALENLEEQGRISVIRPETTLPATRLSRDRPSILGTLEAGRTMARRWLTRQNRHAAEGAPLGALAV
ncbi:MAG TPA: DUF6363 domain-containing protein, partial [Polyangiaceae bacterium]|nr:DUF6363 domain-containing protein [Polyangiaceae bacterium]